MSDQTDRGMMKKKPTETDIMRKQLQIEVHFSVSNEGLNKICRTTTEVKTEHKIQRRKIISTEKSRQITKNHRRNENNLKDHDKKKDRRYQIITVQIQPLIDSHEILKLRHAWKSKRPNTQTLRKVDMTFIPLAEPQIWLSENGLQVIQSCDIYKEAFTKSLAYCFHTEDLQNVCMDFNKELLQWISRLKNFPLTISTYHKKIRKATSKEIEYRKRTINITKPLIRLSKSPTPNNILKTKIMLDKLWSIRFIHQDDKRPAKPKINSVCVKAPDLSPIPFEDGTSTQSDYISTQSDYISTRPNSKKS